MDISSPVFNWLERSPWNVQAQVRKPVLFIRWAKAQIFYFLTSPSLKAGVNNDLLNNRTLVHHFQILWINQAKDLKFFPFWIECYFFHNTFDNTFSSMIRKQAVVYRSASSKRSCWSSKLRNEYSSCGSSLLTATNSSSASLLCASKRLSACTVSASQPCK